MPIMNLERAREAYDYYTGKLSDVARQLSFAGIAVIWILRVGKDSGGISFSKELFMPLGIFVFSLSFDLLHYVYSSIAWGIFHRIMELKERNEFSAHSWINWPSLIMFWLKVIFCSAGHILLIIYLTKSI